MNNTKPVDRIYTYGASAPTKGDVHGQMRLAQQYRNERVEIQRTCVNALAQLHTTEILELGPINYQIEANRERKAELYLKLETLPDTRDPSFRLHALPVHLRASCEEAVRIQEELESLIESTQTLRKQAKTVIQAWRDRTLSHHMSASAVEKARAQVAHVLQRPEAKGYLAAKELDEAYTRGLEEDLWFFDDSDDDAIRTREDFEQEFRTRAKAVCGPKETGAITQRLLREQASSGDSVIDYANNVELYQNEQSKAAYQRFKKKGLTVGTRAVIDTAFKAGLKKQVWPSFSQNGDTCRIGKQLMKKPGTALLFQGTDGVRIKLGSPVGRRRPARGKAFPQTISKARGFQAELTMNLSGLEVVVPFIYHRPLPEDAEIKYVHLKCFRVGLVWRYEVQFTLSSLALANVSPPKFPDAAVMVQPSWTRLPDGGIRAATLTVDQSAKISPSALSDLGFIRNADTEPPNWTKHVDLTPWAVRGAERKNLILSASDKYFDYARKCLSQEAKLSPELSKLCHLSHRSYSTIGKWRAHGKLAGLVRRALPQVLSEEDVRALWAKWLKACNVVAGSRGPKLDLFADPQGEAGVPAPISTNRLEAWIREQGLASRACEVLFFLEVWRRKDAHLINYARGIERRLVLSRRERYRIETKTLAATFGHVNLRNADLKKASRKASKETAKQPKLAETANQNLRALAATSYLTAALKERFGSERFTAVSNPAPARGTIRQSSQVLTQEVPQLHA